MVEGVGGGQLGEKKNRNVNRGASTCKLLKMEKKLRSYRWERARDVQNWVPIVQDEIISDSLLLNEQVHQPFN